MANNAGTYIASKLGPARAVTFPIGGSTSVIITLTTIPEFPSLFEIRATENARIVQGRDIGSPRDTSLIKRYLPRNAIYPWLVERLDGFDNVLHVIGDGGAEGEGTLEIAIISSFEDFTLVAA